MEISASQAVVLRKLVQNAFGSTGALFLFPLSDIHAIIVKEALVNFDVPVTQSGNCCSRAAAMMKGGWL